MDWLEALRALPPERVFVDHEPPTPRYARAEVLLRSLIELSDLVGVRPDPERTSAWLIAVWCAQTSRRRRGFYSCFRLFIDEGAVFAQRCTVSTTARMTRPALTPEPRPKALRL